MAKYKLENIHKNFMKEVRASHNKEVRQNVFELLRRIILKTPVKTGLAKANWQINISRPGKNKVLFNGDPNSAEAIALSKGLDKLQKVEIGRTIYIFNNLPYIGLLEEGSSKQAGKGMVQVSLNELETLFK